jgi:hypothetical protein
MAMTRRTAGEYLLEKGLITQEQLEDARRVQQSTGKELIQIFLDQTLVSERDAYEAKSVRTGDAVCRPRSRAARAVRNQCRQRAYRQAL